MIHAQVLCCMYHTVCTIFYFRGLRFGYLSSGKPDGSFLFDTVSTITELQSVQFSKAKQGFCFHGQGCANPVVFSTWYVQQYNIVCLWNAYQYLVSLLDTVPSHDKNVNSDFCITILYRIRGIPHTVFPYSANLLHNYKSCSIVCT